MKRNRHDPYDSLRFIAEFGINSVPAGKLIHDFYSQAHDPQNADIRNAFDEWKDRYLRLTCLDRVSSGDLSFIPPKFKTFQTTPEPFCFFFSLQTFYACLVKLLTIRLICEIRGENSLFGFFPSTGSSAKEVRRFFHRIESGEEFLKYGLAGFHERDFLSWYTEIPDDSVFIDLKGLIDLIKERIVTFPGLNYEAGRIDYLKGYYMDLVPRRLRHKLGEYYTPDWLADWVVGQALEHGTRRDGRFLDPACGSGAFLLSVIRRIRADENREDIDDFQLLRSIFNRVVGIDLNPQAALTSRFNYLLFTADLISNKTGEISVPVHNFDSILRQSLPKDWGTFDYVAGNPPWINWEGLPKVYKKKTRELWLKYGLFPHKGMDSILGKGKKDLAMLMTCVAADKYLKKGGCLAFILTQSVFKTSGAGQGFRRFVLPDGYPLEVLKADDMAAVQPFPGTANRTSVIYLKKGSETVYPLTEYYVWKKKDKKSALNASFTLNKILEETERVKLSAEPVDSADRTSAWLTASPRDLKTLKNMLGQSFYKAHEGCNSGGANAVYWAEIVETVSEGKAKIRNIIEGAKRKVEQSTSIVERERLFPLLRPRDISRWHAQPSANVIMVQDPVKKKGMPEKELKERCPGIYDYLSYYEDFLRGRALFRRYFKKKDKKTGLLKDAAPFYSMFNVGEYTFSSCKAVWTRMARIEAAAVFMKNGRVIIPQETLAFVDCKSKAEAYYLAAVVNSAIFQFAASAFSQKGGKSMGSMYILKYIKIPRFNESDPVHARMAALSEKAHSEKSKRRQISAGVELDRIEKQIDVLALELWR